MELVNQDRINIYDFEAGGQPMHELGPMIKTALMDTGYIVIRNCNVDVEDLDAARKLVLETTEMIGTPISHDANNAIIWDIKSNGAVNGGVVTYSEHTHEADLHTDSQYSEHPEEAFSLLSLKKADCGGGESYLLSLKDILTELRALPNGERIEHVLRSFDYPFIVPNVFKKSSEAMEFNFGPLLKDNVIRFRVDTLEKALQARPDLCTEEQIEAYKVLKEIILNSPATQYFFLEPRDLIFINNLTMLHGRSAFTDPHRHLLRVRFNLN